MTIHKIRKPTAAFEVIPRSTLQDPRLTLNELGALVRLASLPDGWSFIPSRMQKMLGIGRDKRKAIQRKLRELGYHNLMATRNPSGEWEYEYVFSVAGDLPPQIKSSTESIGDDVPSSNGNSGDGENFDDIDRDPAYKGQSNSPDFQEPGDEFSGHGLAGDGEGGAFKEKSGGESTDSIDDIPPPTRTTDGEGGGFEQSPSIDDFLKSAVWGEEQAGREIRNMAGFLATVRKRIEVEPSLEDWEIYRRWREAMTGTLVEKRAEEMVGKTFRMKNCRYVVFRSGSVVMVQIAKDGKVVATQPVCREFFQGVDNGHLILEASPAAD